MVRGPSFKFRLAFYPFALAAFGLICFLIVLLALGYNIKLNQEKIILEKTGLIILASKPGDAKVYLDGKPFKKRTPLFSFLTIRIEKVKIGKHNIKIEKADHEMWIGDFDVEPGMVSWGNNILLVHQKREKSDYSLPGNVIGLTSSPDSTRSLITLENKENLTYAFWEINTTNKERKKIYETRVSAGDSYRAISYSFDKERILIEKTTGETKSVLVMEAKENPAFWDLTESFKVSFNVLRFNPRNHGELYGLRENSIFIVDYQNKKLKGTTMGNVSNIYTDDNQGLIFVQKNDENYGLWKLDSNGSSKKNIVKVLPVSDAYQLKYLKEYDRFVILEKKLKDLYIFDGSGETPTSKLLAKNVEWFSASPKSKYIGYYTGGNFYNYDIEKSKTYEMLKDKKIDSVAWFSDEWNLIYSENGKVSLVNYNGFYDKYLFDTAKTIPVMVGPGSANIFFGSKNDKGNLDIATFTFGG